MYSLGLNFTITFSINNDLEKLTFLRNANNGRSKERPPLKMQTDSIRAKVDEVLV